MENQRGGPRPGSGRPKGVKNGQGGTRPRPPRGGDRPGGGRKTAVTKADQETRRRVLLDVFTPEEWRQVALVVLSQTKAGNLMAVLPYLPYLLGSPKQEIEIKWQEVAEEFGEKYGVEPERVTSIVERLKAKRAG